MRRAVSMTGVLLAALVSTDVIGAGDVQVGTWKLNVTKSTFSSGRGPRTTTVKVEPADNGIKVTMDQIRADGTPNHYVYAVKYDGKFYDSANNTSFDMIAYTKIDDSTFEYVMKKKDGRVVATDKIVYSPDGKMRVNTQMGKNQQGQLFVSVMVYDRQN